MNVKVKIAIILSATLFIVLASFIGLSIYSVNAFSESDLIASNVTCNGVYIGDLTKEDAMNLIKSKTLPADMPIKVNYSDKTFEFAPNASGISYNFDSVIDYAYSKGRSGSFFSDLFYIIKSRFSYDEIPDTYNYNEEVFENTINTLLTLNGIEFNNFDIKVYENYASVKINKDLSAVDFPKLYTLTMEKIAVKEEREIELPVTKIEKVTADMIYDKIYVEPKNASFEAQNGVKTLIPHTIGVLVDASDIEKALSEGRASFTVPVTKKHPEVRVEHLSGELFSDVLGSFTSKYNSALIGRTQNVTLSARKINGVILNPGEIFSYNKSVGPRTPAAGFSTATVYTSAGLSEELGGGICQVSSTLYNAALYADLKIVERRNHMYTVGYVRNGLDATVVYGLIDFRFENSLKSPIKIVTSVGGGVLTVTILGKKENNNRVELYTNTLESYPFSEKITEKPDMEPGTRKIIQNGAYGYKINASKVVRDSSGKVIREEFLGTDIYKPLTKMVEKGPDIPIEAPETKEEAPSTEAPPTEAPVTGENEPSESSGGNEEADDKENQQDDITGEEINPDGENTEDGGTEAETNGEQTEAANE